MLPHVDSGYRTALGVAFYNRECELEELAEALKSRRTVIVYGPRNVGKSELVRYFLSRYARERLGLRLDSLVVDARRGAAEKYGVHIDLLEEFAAMVRRLLAKHAPTARLVDVAEAANRAV